MCLSKNICPYHTKDIDVGQDEDETSLYFAIKRQSFCLLSIASNNDLLFSFRPCLSLFNLSSSSPPPHPPFFSHDFGFCLMDDRYCQLSNGLMANRRYQMCSCVCVCERISSYTINFPARHPPFYFSSLPHLTNNSNFKSSSPISNDFLVFISSFNLLLLLRYISIMPRPSDTYLFS